MRIERPQGRNRRRRAGDDRGLRQEGAQGNPAASGRVRDVEARHERATRTAGSGRRRFRARAPISSQNVRSDRILFDTDSYAVDDDDRAVLDSQVAWLQSNRNVRVTIEGHADERGTREYNLALGDRRANAAKNYLAARGIDPRECR